MGLHVHPNSLRYEWPEPPTRATTLDPQEAGIQAQRPTPARLDL
jgi:hypothetical protein